MKKIADYIIAAGLAFALLLPAGAALATIYSAGSLLQIGDVQSKHILDGTILNVDISQYANISGTKIAGGTPAGMVILANGSGLATSTTFSLATSTGVLTVPGGLFSSASSTVLGGFTAAGNATTTGNHVISGNLTISGACTGCAGSNVSASFTTDEGLTAGQAVSITDGTISEPILLNGAAQNATDSFGASGVESSMNAWSFTVSATYTGVPVIYTDLKKVLSPADNAVISINTDSAGSPSTTQLASTTVSGASLTTSLANYYLTFNKSITLNTSTTYWVVYQRSGANDDTNYYQQGLNTTTGQQMQKFLGSWSTLTSRHAIDNLIASTTSGHLVVASADITPRAAPFVGIAQATAATGTVAAITIGGIATGLSGLATTSQYYLSNATGTLSTSAGTVSRKACIALSSTTCLITNIW